MYSVPYYEDTCSTFIVTIISTSDSGSLEEKQCRNWSKKKKIRKKRNEQRPSWIVTIKYATERIFFPTVWVAAKFKGHDANRALLTQNFIRRSAVSMNIDVRATRYVYGNNIGPLSLEMSKFKMFFRTFTGNQCHGQQFEISELICFSNFINDE